MADRFLRKNKSRKNKPVKVGSVVHSNDKYFYGTDGYSKNREAVIVGINDRNELVLVKLTTSENPKYKEVLDYSKKSRYMTETLYVKDNTGKAIKLSNVKNVTDEYKFIRSYFPDVSEKAVKEILKVVLSDRRFAKRNKQNLTDFYRK